MKGPQKDVSIGNSLIVHPPVPGKVKIKVVDYTKSKIQEHIVQKIEDVFSYKTSQSVTWINIIGKPTPAIIQKIGVHFGLHHMTQEDILTTDHRPKIEDLDEYLFLLLKIVSFEEEKKEIGTEQVSLVIGPKFVLTFQEKEGEIFDALLRRISIEQSRARKLGSDYLAYEIVDAIVDNYFMILEKIESAVAKIEKELIEDPQSGTMNTIHALESEVLFLRKSVWPLREVVSNLQRSDSKLIKESTGVYLRDVYDHTIQVIDTIETFREMLAGMLNIYLSSMSNRMNQIMKVLTIIATIFIPLTFITGVYGMNFKYMPELYWKWGYMMIWSVMAGLGIFMFLYFKRKDWF
ncbi:MAG: magnesium/cobalt transporter CorA [archaeon]